MLDAQMRCAKQLAFERKQRALRDAVQFGDWLVRKKRLHTLSACLTAWRLTVAKFRAVGAALRRRSRVTLEGAFASWQQFLQCQVRRVRLGSRSHERQQVEVKATAESGFGLGVTGSGSVFSLVLMRVGLQGKGQGCARQTSQGRTGDPQPLACGVGMCSWSADAARQYVSRQ